MSTKSVAEAMIKAQEAHDQAKLALAQAKAQVVAEFTKAGITTEVVGDKRVELIDRPVPNVDGEKLASLVSASVYKKVTKLTIDKAKYDSAVTLGLITPEVAQAVDLTKRSLFPQVFDVKNAKAKAESDANVTSITKVS
ncbi:MAG: hypothetical protein ACO395_04735 [Pontimonas sp.]|jgi:hypothetical protein